MKYFEKKSFFFKIFQSVHQINNSETFCAILFLVKSNSHQYRSGTPKKKANSPTLFAISDEVKLSSIRVKGINPYSIVFI